MRITEMTVGHYIVYSVIPLVVYIRGTEWSMWPFILSFSVPKFCSLVGIKTTGH